MKKATETENQWVDAKGLLQELFNPKARPTERWVRDMQRKRIIPFIKIGRLVRFDVDAVRKALAK